MISEIYHHALCAGIDPLMFWELTPWQCSKVCRAHRANLMDRHNSSAWMMWHGALLSHPRKKFPKLDEFLIKDQASQKNTQPSDKSFKKWLENYQMRKAENNG